jgi:hypothetical protein
MGGAERLVRTSGSQKPDVDCVATFTPKLSPTTNRGPNVERRISAEPRRRFVEPVAVRVTLIRLFYWLMPLRLRRSAKSNGTGSVGILALGGRDDRIKQTYFDTEKDVAASRS